MGANPVRRAIETRAVEQRAAKKIQKSWKLSRQREMERLWEKVERDTALVNKIRNRMVGDHVVVSRNIGLPGKQHIQVANHFWESLCSGNEHSHAVERKGVVITGKVVEKELGSPKGESEFSFTTTPVDGGNSEFGELFQEYHKFVTNQDTWYSDRFWESGQARKYRLSPKFNEWVSEFEKAYNQLNDKGVWTVSYKFGINARPCHMKVIQHMERTYKKYSLTRMNPYATPFCPH
jgi:hypothetical protein